MPLATVTIRWDRQLLKQLALNPGNIDFKAALLADLGSDDLVVLDVSALDDEAELAFVNGSDDLVSAGDDAACPEDFIPGGL